MSTSMDCSKKHLPGVKYVEVAKANQLQFNSIGELGGNYPVEVTGEFKLLELIGLGKLEVKEESEGVSSVFTTTLTLKSRTNWIGYDLSKCVFKVTLVSGETYIIGWNGRPYPLVTLVDKVSDSITESRGNRLTILWKAQIPPLLEAD